MSTAIVSFKIKLVFLQYYVTFWQNIMHIKHLQLENYRGFLSAEFVFQPGINVLFGPNGSGKSSLLEALSTMLSWHIARLKAPTAAGRPFRNEQITNDCAYSRVTMQLLLESGGNMTSSLVKKRGGYESHEKTNLSALSDWATHIREQKTKGEIVRYPLMAFYGAHRAVLDIPLRIRNKHQFEALSGYEEALDGGSHFRRFFEWFREREDIENEKLRDNPRHRDPGLECIRRTWQAFMPELSGFRIRRSHLALTAIKAGKCLEVSQLSDGEKCLLTLVGDIARRLTILNGDANLSAEDILKSSGIVLIDELDLHLHPLWQRRVITQLPKVFPNMQFVVSSHSPEMLSELDAAHIINVTSPASPPMMGRGFSSAEVLEHVMGGDVWPEDVRQAINETKLLINNEKETEARARLNELKRSLPQDAPIVTSLETEINFFA